MKWYLLVDAYTGRQQGAVFAKSNRAARIWAHKLFGWHSCRYVLERGVASAGI